MNKSKLTNQYTINFDDDYKNMINKIAAAYNRKPAELLRLLLLPALHDVYTTLMMDEHPQNKSAWIKL